MNNKANNLRCLGATSVIWLMLLFPLTVLANTNAEDEEERATETERQPDASVKVKTSLSTLDELLEVLSRMSISKTKPSLPESIEAGLEIPSPASQGRPSPTPQNSPPTGGTGAGTSQQTGQPSNDGGQASNGDGRASSGNGQPSSGDGRASNDGGQPSSGDGRASSGDGRASSGDGRASSGDGRASSGDGRASSGNGRATGVNGKLRVGSGRVGVSVNDGKVSVDINTGGSLFPIFNPLILSGEPSANSKNDGAEGSKSPGSPTSSTRPGPNSGLDIAKNELGEIIGSLDKQLEDFAKQGQGKAAGTATQTNVGGTEQSDANPNDGNEGDQNGGEDGYYDPSQTQIASTQSNSQQNNRRQNNRGASSQETPDYSIGSGSTGAAGSQTVPTQKDLETQIPPDLRNISNDDIVARQLRAAAIAETDLELKEKLWDEYRKYKNI